MKKTKELSFEELVEIVKDPNLVNKDIAFKIFEFIADDNGYFKSNFNPYRSDDDSIFYKLLFDEDGDSWYYVKNFLSLYLENKKCDWNSDLVKLYHFNYMDNITHGSYSTIYAWR